MSIFGKETKEQKEEQSAHVPILVNEIDNKGDFVGFNGSRSVLDLLSLWAELEE
jgi:hypothetical protein